jgi:hypothetical protein
MTEPHLAAPSAPQRSVTGWMHRLAEETKPTSTDVAAPPAGLGSGVLLALGLLWLAITMWTAHASILGNSGDPAVALGSAAGALPGVIAASLLAGGTAGLALVGRLGRSGGPLRLLGRSGGPVRLLGRSGGPLRRLLVGLAAGSVCGLLAAGAILYGYGANSSIAVLAVTVGIAGAVGGAAAALPSPVFAAGIVATLVVFLAGVLFNLVQPQLTNLLDLGNTLQSQASASEVFAYTQSAVSGLLAGVAGYWYLRRRDERPWPWYLLAGALPGLLMLATEALTHLGGSSLFGIVKGFSAWDRAMIEFTDFARFRNALVVLFVGGLAAMIAVGRTLSRPSSSSSDEAEADE